MQTWVQDLDWDVSMSGDEDEDAAKVLAVDQKSFFRTAVDAFWVALHRSCRHPGIALYYCRSHDLS